MRCQKDRFERHDLKPDLDVIIGGPRLDMWIHGNLKTTDKPTKKNHIPNEPPPPVICRTRYIPLPSSIDLLLLIPITLFGLGRGVTSPSCFVGLPESCLVGLSPPPVSCRKIPESPPPRPVNWRAMVVVPVN